MLLHQFRQHLVQGVVRIGDFLTRFDVAEIDDFEVFPVVEKLIKGCVSLVKIFEWIETVTNTGKAIPADMVDATTDSLE